MKITIKLVLFIVLSTLAANAIAKDKEYTINSISIKDNPRRTSYTPGAALDLTGLWIYAITNNGDTIPKSEGYTSNPTEGTVLNKPGIQKIEISFAEKTTSFDIQIRDILIDSIKKIGLPLLEIHADSEPTCEMVSAPQGCWGAGQINANKAKGELTITQKNKTYTKASLTTKRKQRA